ncbi:MAG: MBL fold metallo-hydrolase [Propionibacteriaceae bacterium]|jgi:glyoxylase-like metal-dependent hydrolase (beta-lactamase superfamily II)|nr:MBL fold metallo-hydrolase [Propionibacteriaceae bacterium]
MEFVEVRPGVFTAVLEVEQVTTTLVVGARRALLVDTGASPAQGAAIRQAVRSITDIPLEVVVLTHGHWDHAYGLEAFADLDTIGHENLAQDLACAENRAWSAKQGVAPPGLPKTNLASIGVRDLGDLVVEIAHFGPAHTRSDLIIAIPQRSTIIVGDLVEGEVPQFDETSSLAGWARTLDSLCFMLKPDTVIIPGHGAALSPLEVVHFRARLSPDPSIHRC